MKGAFLAIAGKLVADGVHADRSHDRCNRVPIDKQQVRFRICEVPRQFYYPSERDLRADENREITNQLIDRPEAGSPPQADGRTDACRKNASEIPARPLCDDGRAISGRKPIGILLENGSQLCGPEQVATRRCFSTIRDGRRPTGGKASERTDEDLVEGHHRRPRA